MQQLLVLISLAFFNPGLNSFFPKQVLEAFINCMKERGEKKFPKAKTVLFTS
jgi:hypothetical protein